MLGGRLRRVGGCLFVWVFGFSICSCLRGVVDGWWAEGWRVESWRVGGEKAEGVCVCVCAPPRYVCCWASELRYDTPSRIFMLWFT